MYKKQSILFFTLVLLMSASAFAETRYSRIFKDKEVKFFDTQNVGKFVTGNIAFYLGDDKSVNDPIFKKGETLHFGFYDEEKFDECAVLIGDHVHMSSMFQDDTVIKSDSETYKRASEKLTFNCTNAQYAVMIQPIQYLNNNTKKVEAYSFLVQFYKRMDGNVYLGRVQTPKMNLSERSFSAN